MAERLLHQLPDHELEAALRRLSPAVAWPSATLPDGADIAAAVRARVESMPISERGREPVPGGFESWRASLRTWRWSWRPARRALVLALIALLAVVAVAGALVLGLPGLRITLGEAPPSASPVITSTGSPSATAAAPTPSPAPDVVGGSMGLGELLDATDPEALNARAGFDVRAPADPAIGEPDAVYIDDGKGGQVTMLWATKAGLPATLEPTVGLLLSQFRGDVDDGFFQKATSSGTTIERVDVGGHGGFWLSGEPHVLFWNGIGGFIDDPRRWVGDVLLWSDGEITYRLETSLGRDDAIRIAESLP